MNNVNLIFLVNNFNYSAYQSMGRRACSDQEYKEKVKIIEGAFDVSRVGEVVPLEYQGGVWQVETEKTSQPVLNQIPIVNADIGYGQDGRYVTTKDLKAVFVDKLF